MGILQKIQNQPEHIRKIVFWMIIIILGVGLLFWWGKRAERRLREFRKEEFIEELNLPQLKEKLEKMPEMKIPEIKAE